MVIFIWVQYWVVASLYHSDDVSFSKGRRFFIGLFCFCWALVVAIGDGDVAENNAVLIVLSSEGAQEKHDDTWADVVEDTMAVVPDRPDGVLTDNMEDAMAIVPFRQG